MAVVLISTYDLGRQPFGLASPAAWLRDAGLDVTCLDLSRQRLVVDAVRDASLIAFFLPMHTATRLALPVIDRVRGLNPSATLAAYGLYAPLNAPVLRERGVHEVLGGEFEEQLVEVAKGAVLKPGRAIFETPAPLPRLAFKTPWRDGLPPLSQYATLQVGADRRIGGYTEASRGCKHHCRHCPIVPVYQGRFRIVSSDVVVEDIRAQVQAGARHITFGDPDFFNGIRHARGIVERFGREFPGITYDVTIKVEHLLEHADALPLLRDTGCAFVTSAVESVDDDILRKLEKGHTRAGFERAVALCRAAGITLAPTFVAFTPWTTLSGYCELLRAVERLDLVEQVAPIQLAIRLLVPEGSRLLELDQIRAVIGPYSSTSLTYQWAHPDPAVDALQRTVEQLVGGRLSADRATVFRRIWQQAHEAAGLAAPFLRDVPLAARATIPYLNEPWYC